MPTGALLRSGAGGRGPLLVQLVRLCLGVSAPPGAPQRQRLPSLLLRRATQGCRPPRGARHTRGVPGRVVPGGPAALGGGGSVSAGRGRPEAPRGWSLLPANRKLKGDLSLLTLCLPRQDPDPFPHRKPGRLGGGQEGIPWAGQEAGLPVGRWSAGWGRVSHELRGALRTAPGRGVGVGVPGRPCVSGH